MSDRDNWIAALAMVAILMLVVWAIREDNYQQEIATLQEVIAAMPAPATVIIESQEMRRLICPDGAKLYTTTEGIRGGYGVFCRQ